MYQSSISCFQEDIDPISKILKILLNRSSGIVGARLFDFCQKKWSFEIVRFKKIICSNSPGVLSIFLRCPGVSRDKNSWFGRSGHVQKSPNHRNEELGGSPISNSKNYYTKSKQNNSTKLSNLLFLSNYHKHHCQYCFL